MTEAPAHHVSWAEVEQGNHVGGPRVPRYRGGVLAARGAKRNKLANVWVFVQMIFGRGWSMNQLHTNPNIG